jgi:peptidoglycan/LPS O-acetylase OafA/YrhL
MEHTINKAYKHVPYLDSLRAIAALIVVTHHACLQFDFSDSKLNFFQRFVLFWFQNGHYSVDFFIVLSGYCLMLAAIRNHYYTNGGFFVFLLKRAKRILPPYYAATTFSLLLILCLINKHTGSHWDTSIPVNYFDIITHALLIQDVFTTTYPKINHVLWSISVEWRIYFIFPILLSIWRKTGPISTITITALSSLLLTYALNYGHSVFPIVNNGPNGLVPHYLLLFTLGIFGAEISFSKKKLLSEWSINHWCYILVGATLILTIASIMAKSGMVIYWQLLDVIVGFWSLSLLVICNKVQGTESRHLFYVNNIISWRPLVFVGTFGYSLYLIHAPILQLIWQYALVPLKINPFTGFLLLSSAGLMVILASSHLFYLLFERPFISKRQAASVINLVIN